MSTIFRIQAWDAKRGRYDDVSVIYDRFGPVDWEVASAQAPTDFEDLQDAVRDMESLPGRAVYCCVDVNTGQRFFDDSMHEPSSS